MRKEDGCIGRRFIILLFTGELIFVNWATTADQDAVVQIA